MEHNFKHTPGPWSIESVDGQYVLKIAEDTLNPATRIANLKLAGAAPDLLEAIIDLVVQCEAKYGFEHSSMYSEIQAAKDAIKKATE